MTGYRETFTFTFFMEQNHGAGRGRKSKNLSALKFWEEKWKEN
jgi:hypothetical protein